CLLGAAAVVDRCLDGTWDAGRAVDAAAGAAALLVAFGVLYLIPRGGLGLGDVKLVGLLGAALGWIGPPALVLVGPVVGLPSGGLSAGSLLGTRRARGSDPIAYGPHLLLGAFLAVVLGS